MVEWSTSVSETLDSDIPTMSNSNMPHAFRRCVVVSPVCPECRAHVATWHGSHRTCSTCPRWSRSTIGIDLDPIGHVRCLSFVLAHPILLMSVHDSDVKSHERIGPIRDCPDPAMPIRHATVVVW